MRALKPALMKAKTIDGKDKYKIIILEGVNKNCCGETMKITKDFVHYKLWTTDRTKAVLAERGTTHSKLMLHLCQLKCEIAWLFSANEMNIPYKL